MAVNWDSLFGSDFFIRITNEERRYLGLNPIEDDWEITRYFSKTNITYKRTTVYWDGVVIKKIICEENRIPSGQSTPVTRSIAEHDTFLKTENREKILPLTSRGKLKPVTASDILSVTPLGCSFYLFVDTLDNQKTYMSVYNARNNCSLAIGESERIVNICNDETFHSFMNYYIMSCPDDYFDRINRLRTAKHKTVKYKTGDIFRIELDRFNYCYGLITGQVREILKWPDLPEHHSLGKLMMVPIMVRYYKLITKRSDLTVSELSEYPLSRVEIYGDNDIIWGTHTIVGHKQLTEDDIEFNLVCTKIKNLNDHVTTHTYDGFVADGLLPDTKGYNLYVEWGTAQTVICYEQITERMKAFLKSYRDPHGGVRIGVFPDLTGESFSNKMNLLNPENAEMKKELFSCLGLSPDADFDTFAKAFNGLTKKEILNRLLC